MGRLSYFFKRLFKMDWKAMWKTAGLLHERSGKSRIWLLCDMLRCAVKYNAGYVDYKIAQMYKLNDAQRKTVITRGISNSIVRRMNDKAYWHFFDDKTQFNELFKEWIPRKWLLINADTPLDKLEDMMTLPALIGKPLEGSSGQGILKFTPEDWKGGRKGVPPAAEGQEHRHSGRNRRAASGDGAHVPDIGQHLPHRDAAG